MPRLAPLPGGRTPGRLTSVQHGMRVAAAALLSVMLSGCGSLYLHNDAAAKSTAQAKTELDKVDMAALFDNEEAYLKDLEKRENAAVAEQFSAWRDEELLEILQGADDTDGRFTLTFHIDQYLEFLTGRSDRVAGSAGRLAKAVTDAYADVTEETTLAKALKTRVNPTPPPENSTASSPNGALSLASAIEELQAQEAGLKKKEADAKAAQAAFKEQLKKAGDALGAGQTSQAAFSDIVTKLNQLLADAKAGTEKANPYVGQLISEALLEKVDHLIDVTNPKGLGDGGATDSEARAALGFIHAAFGVGDAFANPPRVPHPNALAATKAWLTYVAGQAETDLAETRAKQAVLGARVAAVAQQI